MITRCDGSDVKTQVYTYVISFIWPTKIHWWTIKKTSNLSIFFLSLTQKNFWWRRVSMGYVFHHSRVISFHYFHCVLSRLRKKYYFSVHKCLEAEWEHDYQKVVILCLTSLNISSSRICKPLQNKGFSLILLEI